MIPSKFEHISYTFEEYVSPHETRTWYERFVREHNKKRWSLDNPGAVSCVITAPNQRWIRIEHWGTLIAYARINCAYRNSGFPIISDVYVLPRHRGKGHYHQLFHDLVVFSKAHGVCLTIDKLAQYGSFYKQYGFVYSYLVSAKANLYYLLDEQYHKRQQLELQLRASPAANDDIVAEDPSLMQSKTA